MDNERMELSINPILAIISECMYLSFSLTTGDLVAGREFPQGIKLPMPACTLLHVEEVLLPPQPQGTTNIIS